jgi:hypothetical protein
MGDRRAVVAVIACAASLVYASACSHAWDALEPTGGAASGGSGTTSAQGGRGGASTTTSSSSGGSGGGTGGAMPGRCGGTDILSWDFSDDQWDIWNRDPGFYRDAEQGVLSLPANASETAYDVILTPRRYDLRGDRVHLEVLDVPNQDASGWGGIAIVYNNGDDLFFDVYEGNLECGYDRGGNDVIPAKVPYDPNDHRYWQIREDQGTIHCETSKDGASWSSVGSFGLAASSLPAPSAIAVYIYAGTPDHISMPGEFRFDNLNGGGPAGGRWCRSDSYTDDFSLSTDPPGPAWLRAYDYNGAGFDQVVEQLNFRSPNTDSGAGYQSSVSYDMTGQRVSMEVVTVPQGPGAGLYFGAGNNDDFEIYWDIADDRIACGYDDQDQGHTIWQGPPLAGPTYLGFREADGKTYCEVFENGTWKSLGFMTGTVDPTHVDVYMGMWVGSSADPDDRVGTFDDYNIAPAMDP